MVGKYFALAESTIVELPLWQDQTEIAPLNHVGQTFIDRRNVDSKGKKIVTADNMFMMRRLDFQVSAETRIEVSDEPFRKLSELANVLD